MYRVLANYIAVLLLLLLLLGVSLPVCSALPWPAYCGRMLNESLPIPPPPDNFASAQLRQAIVFMRHGDRTVASSQPCWLNDTTVFECNLFEGDIPIIGTSSTNYIPRLYRKRYMNDRNDFLGNCAMGQLTSTGYQQQLLNGQDFRNAYIDTLQFLPQTYNASQIYLRVDDIPRTIMSLEALMLALYPPSQTTNNQANIIDFHTMDYDRDDIQPNGVICPALQQQINAATNSSEFELHYDQITLPLTSMLQKVTGIQDLNIGHVHDCLSVRICHQQQLPWWANESIYESMLAEVIYQGNYSLAWPNRPIAAQYGIGFLLNDMYQLMIKAVDDAPQYKFLLWSGHDTTLLPLLVAFNVFDGTYWPCYAGRLIIEFWEFENQLYVRLMYQNTVLIIPACGTEMCPMTTFLSVLKPLLATSTAHCNSFPPATH